VGTPLGLIAVVEVVVVVVEEQGETRCQMTRKWGKGVIARLHHHSHLLHGIVGKYAASAAAIQTMTRHTSTIL